MSRLRTPGRRTRRRANTVPTRSVLGWGALSALAIGLFFWLGASLFNRVPLRDYGSLNVSVRDVGNISTHDPVRIAGVRVGQVLDTRLIEGGRSAFELQLEPGVNIPTDTKALVRANGLLGARYVELVPGRAATDLPDGATLRAADNALTYGVPEALAALDEPTRKALGTAVGGLGQGFLGRGMQLNNTLDAVAHAVPDELRLVRTLNTAPEANAALIPSLDAAMRVLSANRRDLGRMLGPAAEGVKPLRTERPAVQQTLEAAPGTLVPAGNELERGRRLLGAARSLTVAARSTLHAAPAGLRSATRLLAEAQRPVGRANGLLRAVDTTVPPTLKVVKALSPVLTPLRQGLDALTPTVSVLGRYGCDVQNFATTWRSMTEYGGTGEGPAGPAMAFRLQIIPPSIPEAIGAPDPEVRKDPYPAPCKWGPSVYPKFVPSGVGR